MRSGRSRSAPPAPSVPIAKALGMSVVAMPATEPTRRCSAARSTAPVSVGGDEELPPQRAAEGASRGSRRTLAASFVIVANTKAFDNLTPTQQGGADEGERRGRLGADRQGVGRRRRTGRNDAKQKGNVIETIAPAEFDQWRPLLQFVTDEWIKKARTKGLDGRKLLDDLQAMIKAASS